MHLCVDIIREKALMLNLDVSKRKCFVFEPLSANPAKWSNTLEQFIGKIQRIVLSVFDHFVGFALNFQHISHFFLVFLMLTLNI